jgi:aldehyde dehydrogenase (NAD+)
MEAFGPVALLQKYRDFDDAIRIVNDSEFGLQAGVFTFDVRRAMRAWDELDVGGVVIGDVPSFRVDNMPYGGVKDSGLGREGIRYAIEDMTEIRLMVMRDP